MTEQHFSALCQRLQWNDSTVKTIYWGDEDDDDEIDEEFDKDYYVAVPFDDSHLIRFGNSLVQNTGMKTLSFVFETDGDFRCTAKGVEALAKGIRSSCLKTIHFSWSSFELQRCMFEIIRQSPTIQHLDFHNTNIDFISLSNLLGTHAATQLRSLTMDGYDGFDYNIRNMLAVLRNNKSIRTLNLNESQVVDEDIATFVGLWAIDSPIENLILRQNGFGPESAQLLMRATVSHAALLKLDVSYNPSIGYHGLRMIGEELSNSRLVELDISGCVRENSRSPIGTIQTACMALAEGLSRSVTIQSLKCAGNDFGLQGLKVLLGAAMSHPTLTCLELSLDSPDEIRTLGNGLTNAKLTELKMFLTSECQNRVFSAVAFQAFADGIRTNSSLRTLELAGKWLGPVEIHLLMVAIASHPNMEKLNLSQGLCCDALKVIGKALTNTRLKSLRLDTISSGATTNCRVEACQSLSEGLRNSTTLQELDLRCIDLAGALVLVEAVTNHPTMRNLKLFLGDDVCLDEIKWIARFLPDIRLTELVIRVVDSGRRRPIQSSRSKSARRARHDVSVAMKNNVRICRLKIPDLGISEKLAFYVERNRLGRLGWIGEEGAMPTPLWCQALFQVNTKPSLIYYCLQEQPWLVSSGGNGRKRRISEV